MKKFIGVLAALLVFAGVAVAGPTVSLGTAWYGDTFSYGVGFGLQANDVLWDFLGFEAEFSIAGLGIDPYDDPAEPDYSYMYGFGRVNATFALSSGSGPQFYFLYGFGSPVLFQWDSDNVETLGVNIGTVFGFAYELPAGHGLSILGYWEKGTLAVGAEIYIDLYGLAAKRIVEVDTNVSKAVVGEPTPLVPSDPCADKK